MFTTPFESPKFLFLEDVFKKDIQRNMSDLLPREEPIYIDYKVPPKLFCGISAWPESTNVHCWHCTLQFDGRPVFIPDYIEPLGHEEYTMSAHGVFCSFHCAISYASLIHLRINDRIDTEGKIRFLYSIFNKCKMPFYIDPAPAKQELRRFGGELTDTQYRQVLKTLKVH